MANEIMMNVSYIALWEIYLHFFKIKVIVNPLATPISTEMMQSLMKSQII